MRKTLIKIISLKRTYEAFISVYEGVETLGRTVLPGQKLYQVKQAVRYINAMTSLLDNEEMFVVQKRIIDKMSWTDVLREYEVCAPHNHLKSTRGLQRILSAALNKMEQFAKQTPALVQALLQVQGYAQNPTEGICEDSTPCRESFINIALHSS